MTSAQTNDIRRTEILNVAVSTDTILYTPFFLAYYSGDFDNTPFGKLSVNIIGSEDDARFIQSQKLKGDGFATFCLLFGLADAAICDPSFVVYLKDCGDIAKEFSTFEKLLTTYTKSTLSEDNKYKEYLEYKNETLEIKDVGKFKDLFNDKKVIGGLISKIAFSVVGSPDIEAVSNSDDYKGSDKFGKIHKRTAAGVDFTKNIVTGKFLYYESPSTGHCIGEIHAAIYHKKQTATSASLVEPKDFGNEIKTLGTNGYEKSIAITCDFVSLDYQLNKEVQNKIVELENFANDEHKTNYLFTGIMGNCETKNAEKLRSLLYGIDKNLYTIYKFLKDSNTTGLTKYFKRKFHYTDNRLSELLTLLIADETYKGEINSLIIDKAKPEFTFDTIIRYYVDRLYRCKKYGGLYFNSTSPVEDSLKNITELRYEAIQKPYPTADGFYKQFIENDMLSTWRKKETLFFKYEQNVNQLRLKEKPSDALILLRTPFMLFTKKMRNTLKTKLWLYASKPSYLYTVGSLFLIFEIVSSMSHLFGFHLPKMAIDWDLGDNNSEGKHHRFLSYINLGKIFFVYFNITVVTLILMSRNLLKLKENDKYVYRDE